MDARHSVARLQDLLGHVELVLGPLPRHSRQRNRLHLPHTMDIPRVVTLQRCTPFFFATLLSFVFLRVLPLAMCLPLLIF